MGTINQVKQLSEADTPLLFFQCVLPSGDVERWCSHSIAFDGQSYSARLLKHNLFDLQLSADDAMDGISQLSLTLANADSTLSELNYEIGFKGSQLTVYFAFADLPSGTITTESTVLFRGIAGDPDEVTENSLRLTFSNKLSLRRIPIPDVRVQRTCPWTFPTTSAQRVEAKDGGANGRYSRFYRCGYSADVPGGVGNLTNGQPFISCDGSRGQCSQRGMFNQDNSGNVTQRFGGFEFVPSVITVRTSGAKTSHLSPLLDNTALYNDPVPMIYGTGWLKAPIIFSRNDGNMTHMEVLLGLGTGSGTSQSAPQTPAILKTVVSDIEIPLRIPGQDMTTTGWYSVVTTGARQGSFNPDFSGGDPYGSVAVLSVVVPNRISSGRSLPTVEVLLQGIGLDEYDINGNLTTTNGPTYSNNPAWIILDILRRCGWATTDLNLSTFASAALYCSEAVTTTDLNNNNATVPRSQCNLILTTRQSAASVVRGIRVAASLMLRYGPTGLLELVPETTLYNQQGNLPDGSNSTEPLANGWPAYEFSDGTGVFSGIIRNANGTSSVRMSSRSIAETSNRLSVEFQDEANEYQQDSLSTVDSGDSALIGYEISSQSTALGIANFNQATRVLLRQLDKSTKGNRFIQFQTSFRALKIRPGDIITVTYAKEWLQRVPFRVVKLSPSMNYQTVTILAQIHNDDWYSDNPAVLAGAGRLPGSNSVVPRPLLGTVFSNSNGTTDFGVMGSVQTLGDGTALETVTVNFVQPSKPNSNLPYLPLVSLSSQCSNVSGGTLIGGTSYYYAVSAVDGVGNEGAISFTVPVAVPEGMNAATITGLSFPTATMSFNVYRGLTPQLLYRIANVALAQATSTPTGYVYSDNGEALQPVGPPDPNFDHANFYYRSQYAGPFPATIVSSSTIGNSDMGNVPSVYKTARLARIVSGTGAGQERPIVDNDQTSLTISPGWSVTPDATSSFVIVDSSWKFAAVSVTSPVQFQIPYQAGTAIQVSGRAANVQNQEGSADLCPMTVFNLSGGVQDSGTPGTPIFTLTAPGGGNLTISQISFPSQANIASVTTATLETFTWDEIKRPSISFAGPVAAGDNIVSFPAGITPNTGQIVQAGTELMIIGQQSSQTTNSYAVDRSTLGTARTAHAIGDPVLLLQSTYLVLPFERGFFENQASINYLHTVSMPDCRVFGAQMFVTNAFGDGETVTNTYLGAPLRTVSGGQFSLQVGGYIATQTNAAPALLVQKTHAVRDVWASLAQAAQGYSVRVDILQNGVEYCSFVIPAQRTTFDQTKPGLYVDGATLPPLQEGATLTLNVTLGVNGNPLTLSPGRDLTVTIRF